MAFSNTHWVISSAGDYDSAGIQIWSYKNESGVTDNLAAMRASGYFNDASVLPNVGDKIQVWASDGSDDYRVTAVSPNVTVTDWVTTSAAEVPVTDKEVFVGTTGNVGTSAKLNDTYLGTLAFSQPLGAIPFMFKINCPGGATANFDITVTNKIVVLDAFCVLEAGGTTSDTIQVKNGTSNITNALDTGAGVLTGAVVRATAISTANTVISAGGTLRVTQTDGGGSDCPEVNVYIMACASA